MSATSNRSARKSPTSKTAEPSGAVANASPVAAATDRDAQVDAAFAGIDLLSSAVILVDADLRVRRCNPAAENLFAVSQRACRDAPLATLFDAPGALARALQNALDNNWSYSAHDLVVKREGAGELHLECSVTPLNNQLARLLLEFRLIDRQLQAAREEHAAVQQQANRELIRNLVHEIKNPLGGIRGSAQLLDAELAKMADAATLREYTGVVMHEVDRLQDLMQRLLSPHCGMRPGLISIHDIIEHVRRLILAEFPGLQLRRDYDPSLPDLTCDREQMIQALLNIVRNAAEAISGDPATATQGEIILRTRALRQATLAKRRRRLAIEVQVIDNGPGMDESIRERVFYPLVSGRPGGSGLGLALAQGFVQQHQGVIEFESQPGRTCFSLRLPLPDHDGDKS